MLEHTVEYRSVLEAHFEPHPACALVQPLSKAEVSAELRSMSNPSAPFLSWNPRQGNTERPRSTSRPQRRPLPLGLVQPSSVCYLFATMSVCPPYAPFFGFAGVASAVRCLQACLVMVLRVLTLPHALYRWSLAVRILAFARTCTS